MERPKVFVSYSRHDEELVKPLAGLLGLAADDAVFMDATALKPGDDWKTRIEQAVTEASVFALCWCCASRMSEWVAYEIGVAMRSPEKRIVPVVLCNTPVPQPVSGRQWIDLRTRVRHDCGKHEGAFLDPDGGFIR